jgi:hypothetical protein
MPKTITKKTRNRRTPDVLLANLKAQRQQLAERSEAKLLALDARIAKVESRYEKALKLAEFAGIDEAELDRQLTAARADQKLLKAAIKAKR